MMRVSSRRVTFAVVLAVIAVLMSGFVTGMPLGVREAYAADIASGTYDDVDWRITEDGELIIGNGGTQTFTNGSVRYYSSWPWYSNRSKVKTIRFDGIVNGNGSMVGMFYGMSNMTSIDTTGFDMSNVTDMSNMFYNCRAMTTPPDTSSWVTSNVTEYVLWLSSYDDST